MFDNNDVTRVTLPVKSLITWSFVQQLVQVNNNKINKSPHHCHFVMQGSFPCHDDVIKWKHFPRYWPFVRGIHRSPVNSPHKGQWRGALMFSLICVWINGWINNHEAGDFRRYRAHYDVTVMSYCYCPACRTYLIATRFWVVVICPIIKCLIVLEFSFILFDLCLFITIFNFILN